MSNETTKDYISTLNGLIETCKDGEEGFRNAAVNWTVYRTVPAGYPATALKALIAAPRQAR